MSGAKKVSNKFIIKNFHDNSYIRLVITDKYTGQTKILHLYYISLFDVYKRLINAGENITKKTTMPATTAGTILVPP